MDEGEGAVAGQDGQPGEGDGEGGGGQVGELGGGELAAPLAQCHPAPTVLLWAV